MSFPAGATTITLTGTFPTPAGGTARAGHVIFTPTAVLVDSTQHAIYSGAGPITLDNNGHFTTPLLCTDDTDVQPHGWRWHVDEQPTGGQRRTYYLDLPSTLGASIDLSQLAPVSAPDGSGQSLPPTGPAGGALTGTYPNPALASATIALFDAAGTASAAQAAAISAAATDATAKVSAHAAASDPHADRAYADNKFATQLNLTALGGTVNSLSATVTTLNGFLDDIFSRLAAIEQGTAFLNGVNSTGNVNVFDADLQINGTGKAYRFRRGGSNLDLEATGVDLIVSNWSGTAFNGTQRSYLRLSADAQNIQVAGKVESVTGLYGSVVHTLDPATGVAALGAKNGLGNIRLAGLKPTAGAPTTGTWTAGDVVLDSAGAWHLCTTPGTPGTWT